MPPHHHSSHSSRSLFLAFLIALKPLSLPIQSHAYPVLATSHHHKYSVAPTRVSTDGGTSAPGIRRRAPPGVRKNTRIGPAPSRYGQQQDLDHSTPGTERKNPPSSNSEEPKVSTPQSRQSSPKNGQIHISLSLPSKTISPQSASAISPSDVDSYISSRSSSDIPINLSTRRELLRSHEQHIVDPVFLQLTSNNQNPQSPTPQLAQQLP